MSPNRRTVIRSGLRLGLVVVGLVTASVVGVWLGILTATSLSHAYAQENKGNTSQPPSKGAPTSTIIQVALLSDNMRLALCGEVDASLLAKIGRSETETNFTVASYRLSSDNKTVERYAEIGNAAVDSIGRITVVIRNETRHATPGIWSSLTSNDPLVRQALVLLPKGSASVGKTFAGGSKETFGKAVEADVIKGGLLVFPVEQGVGIKRGTCTCKAFFGCTTGCCTNVTCQDSTIGGFCPSNSNCKRVDLTSNCNCD